MIAYASITGTRVNRAAIEAAGWRWMMTPADLRPGYKPYALDNGAWAAFKAGGELDLDLFQRAVDSHANAADFTVLPDIVGEGARSLALSLTWREKLRGAGRLLLAVQDGMLPEHIEPYLSADVGLFLGGTTEWKLSTGDMWGALKRRLGIYLHIGRVNTAQRVIWCSRIEADSFDGTSASRYSKTLPLLQSAMKQPSILTR